MMQNSKQSTPRVHIAAAATMAIAWALGSVASMAATPVTTKPESQAAGARAQRVKGQLDPSATIQLDRSGQKRTGKASFYADRYSCKTMADGTPMRLYSNNAASITLPLGTTAQVTNLENGRSAIVTIRDRGPYVAGRIVDLYPATARKIGLEHKKGLAKVEVAPLKVPLADGTVKIMPNAVAMASN
jgi:rare lipoprotein A